MVARADILAGRAVILVNIQDTVEAQLRGIRSKMRMFSNSMKEIGGDLFRGGLAGGAASIFPVKDFVAFQDQLLFLQTKLQVTDAAMKPLEKTIRQLGMSTSFTSQEVGKAATDFAQAGFSMIEITNSLQAALDLARGSQIDLSTSTTILANSLRTFNVDTKRAAEFASKFIAAARLGTLDLVDLSESLKYSSGTFALLNVEIDEVLGLITQLSKSSLKASLAGTSLNTAFLNLAGSADKLKELLGVTFTDQDFEQPLIVLTKIEKALQGMSTTKKISIVQDLVNIRGARAVFGEIIQDLGKLDETTKQIKNSTNEARLSADKLDSRLGGVWRRAKSAFEESLLSIGSTTEGPLTKFGEIAAKVFNDISRLAQANEGLTQTILGLGLASLAAGVGILSLSLIFGRLAMFITPLTMLNAQLFKMAGALVGLQLKTFGAIGGAIAAPILKRPQEASKTAIAAAKAQQKLAEAQARYDNNPSKVNKGKLGAAALASKNAASIAASARIGGVLGNTPIPFVRIIEDLFKKKVEESPDFKEITKLGPKYKGTKRPLAAHLDLGTDYTSQFENRILSSQNRSLPILNSSFQRRMPGSGRQQGLPGFNQGLLNFGSPQGNPNWLKLPTPQSIFRSSGNKKIVSPNLWKDILKTALDLKNLKQYKDSPISDVIDQAFTAYDLSDSTKVAFKRKILNFLESSAPKPKEIQSVLNFGGSQGLLDFNSKSGQRLFAPTSVIGRNAPDTSFGFSSPGKTPNPVLGGKRANYWARLQDLPRATSYGKGSLKGGTKPSLDFFKSMGRTIKSLNFGFAFGEVGKVLKSILTGTKNFLSLLWRGAKSVDWVTTTLKTFRGIWSVVRGIFTVLNTVRRVVFSFSGILTILELLLLFGDRIPGINQLMSGAATAFSNLFKNLGETVKSLAPAFTHMSTAIKLMFSGESQSGIIEFKKALSNISDLIGFGLRKSWNQFIEDVKPFADWMKVTLLGTFYTLQAVFETLASNLGTVFKSGKIIIAGDGDFLEILKSAFSVDNMKIFFGSLIELIGSIGQSLNIVISTIGQTLNAVKMAAIGILQSLAILPGGENAQNSLNAMDTNYSKRQRLQFERDTLENEISSNAGKIRLSGKAPTADDLAYLRILQAEIREIDSEIATLGPAFGTFEFNLEESNNALAAFIRKLQENVANIGGVSGVAPGTSPDAAGAAAAANLIGTPVGNVMQSIGGFFGGIFNNGRSPSREAASAGDWISGMFESTDRSPLRIPETPFTGLHEAYMNRIGGAVDEEVEGNWLDRVLALAESPERNTIEWRRALDQANSAGANYDSVGSLRADANSALEGRNEESTRAAANAFLADPAGAVSGAFDFFREGLGSIYAAPPQAAAVTAAIKQSMPVIGKALVGTFDSSRGNMLQGVPVMEKLQKDAVDKLGDIDDKLTDTNRYLEEGGRFAG